ncbi:hypothetical protein [Nonomuraea sp. NPDC049400]|uniref:hypothetical protein n=1 Tax=Nonomuraea sp. NPDC049400 TaxID=3364352 RepID=UPI0037A2C137
MPASVLVWCATLAEHCWARDVAGLSPRTLQSLVKPVVELREVYGALPNSTPI